MLTFVRILWTLIFYLNIRQGMIVIYSFEAEKNSLLNNSEKYRLTSI